MLVDTVIQNSREYIGMSSQEIGKYESLLNTLVENHSAGIYQDKEALENALQKSGADELLIHKIQMITAVTGFQEKLAEQGIWRQNDINALVRNAVRETGFNQMQTLELISAILGSMGVKNFRENYRWPDEEIDAEQEQGFVMPVDWYEKEISDYLARYRQGNFETLKSEDIIYLEKLAKAGLPKAKFYLGCYLMKQENDSLKKMGITYLQEAYMEGEGPAGGVLGDICYEENSHDSWVKAYQYYTGYGSVALQNEQRQRIVDILNYKAYNKELLFGSLLLIVFTLVMTILAPGKALFPSLQWLGYFAFILQSAIFGVAVLRHKKEPYESLAFLPASLFAVWLMHMMLRVLL